MPIESRSVDVLAVLDERPYDSLWNRCVATLELKVTTRGKRDIFGDDARKIHGKMHPDLCFYTHQCMDACIYMLGSDQCMAKRVVDLREDGN
jgi:hypothetical protein